MIKTTTLAIVAVLALQPQGSLANHVSDRQHVIDAFKEDRARISALEADGAVTAQKIADGAVTAAKLGLANMTFIEDSGSDTANCDALLTALSGLTGPATVVLGPGTYDCGSSPVVLPAEVGLIGSGRKFTTIKGSVADNSDGLVRLADDTELRDLTVVNDSGDTQDNFVAVGIGAGSVDTRNWRISDVTVRAIGVGGINQGIVAKPGVDCDGGEMINVTATASGGTANEAIRINCSDGSVTGTNLSATGIGGSRGIGFAMTGAATVTFRNSSFVGDTESLFLGVGTIRVISSELDGPFFFVGGLVATLICVSAYDEAGAALTDGPFDSGGCV